MFFWCKCTYLPDIQKHTCHPGEFMVSDKIIKERNEEFLSFGIDLLKRTEIMRGAGSHKKEFDKFLWSFSPAGMYLLKVDNGNTRIMCEICSK